MSTEYLSKVLLGDIAFHWMLALIVCLLISIRTIIFFIQRGKKRRSRRMRGGKKKRGLPDNIIGRLAVCAILLIITALFTADTIVDVINEDYASVHGVCYKATSGSGFCLHVEGDDGNSHGFSFPMRTKNMAFPYEYNWKLEGTVWYSVRSDYIVGFVPDHPEEIDWKYNSINNCDIKKGFPYESPPYLPPRGAFDFLPLTRKPI